MRDFIDNEGGGMLPLKGALPDMTADTEKYITLQQMYDNRFEMVYEMVHIINISDSFQLS